MSDLYILRIGLHISSSRKGRPIIRIYNSLTDTWMWKLGLRPRYSFSGNICFKFSAVCPCSAGFEPMTSCIAGTTLAKCYLDSLLISIRNIYIRPPQLHQQWKISFNHVVDTSKSHQNEKNRRPCLLMAWFPFIFFKLTKFKEHYSTKINEAV